MNSPALHEDSPFASVDAAIEDMRQGKFVVIVEEGANGSEGDLVVAAQFTTPGAINLMATHARGLICLCLTDDRCTHLRLTQMTFMNEARSGTAFTVSIEARQGISTGISAYDRARTIQVAIDPESGPTDLVRPGHVFPIRVQPGGVLQRAGKGEAAVDLATFAGLTPAGVACQIMKDDGSVAHLPDLVSFCELHQFKLVRIADLVEYRIRREKLVRRGTPVRLPTAFGEFTAIAYQDALNDSRHLALVKGDVAGAKNVLVRVHSRCDIGDVFHATGCGCGEALESSIRRINAEGQGVVLYLASNTRVGLANCERGATGLELVGSDGGENEPQDDRAYGIGFQILVDLGLNSIRVLTNNPKRFTSAEAFGLTVVSQEPLGQGLASLSLVTQG